MNLNLESLRTDFESPLITDRELCFLYGLLTSLNPKTVVEIGGGEVGFSSIIFCDALKYRTDSVLYSIDVLEMQQRCDNHVRIQKSCSEVTTEDLNNSKIDIIFFDAHCVIPQLEFYHNMLKANLITDDTVLILHDTNCFHKPYAEKFMEKFVKGFGEETEEGFIHQWVERNLVNYFKLKGYDVFNLKTKRENHNEEFTHLFGLSICQKFKPFTPIYLDYNK